MPIYMKAPYAQGSVTASGYETWIPLDSISLNVERSISMETGSLKIKSSGVPKFSEFQVSKDTEDASPDMVQQLLSSQTGQTIEIVVVEGKKESSREIIRYTLKDALLASFDVSAGDDGDPYESYSFAYSEIEMKFTPRSAENQGKPPKRVGYKLAVDKVT